VLAVASSVLYGSQTHEDSKIHVGHTLHFNSKIAANRFYGFFWSHEQSTFLHGSGDCCSANRKLIVLGRLEKLDNIQSVLGNLVSKFYNLESRVKV
jgi:hypothetical protein